MVGDVRNDGLNAAPEAELYLLADIIPLNPVSFVVRSSLPPAQLLTELRRAIRRVDPMLAMHDVKTMNAIVGESLQLETDDLGDDDVLRDRGAA